MKNWFVSSLLFWFGNTAYADDYQQAETCLSQIDIPCARKLLERRKQSSPTSSKTLKLQANVLFHEGKYRQLEQTLDTLDHPVKDDERGPPYRATIAGAKGLKDYRRDGISIRHGTGVEYILAFESWDVLDRSKRIYAGLFGGVPSHELVMDVFPTAARFIMGSGLPPEAVRTTGVIALSKWSRLLLTSPRTMSRGYAWKDTAAHEYIHLVVAWRTQDKAPVWLQEGLAKYYEGAWRGSFDNYMSGHQQNLLAKAIKGDSFVPFEKFRYSMAYLDSSEEASLAFAQVSSMVAFLENKAGRESISVLMDKVKNGVDAQLAVSHLAGFSDFEAFRNAWKKYIASLPLIQDKLMALPVALDGVGGEFADDPLLSVRHDLAKYVRLGDLLMEKKRPKAALIEYEKAKDEDDTPSPLLIARKAQCLLQLKRMDEAKKMVERGVLIYPEFPLLLTTLATIHQEEGQLKKALERYRQAHDLNPFDPKVQHALAELYMGQQDMARSERHSHYASILDAGGGGAEYLPNDSAQQSIHSLTVSITVNQQNYSVGLLLDAPLSESNQITLIKQGALQIIESVLNENGDIDDIKKSLRSQIALTVNPLLLPNRILTIESVILDK